VIQSLLEFLLQQDYDVPPIPILFSPAIGATSVAVASNIIITFSQLMQKGTGNITLRENSAGGTAFSTIGVSSSSVTISGGAVTIDPPSTTLVLHLLNFCCG
jgi:hypothetical protein